MSFRCQQLLCMWPVQVNYMSMTFASKCLPISGPSLIWSNKTCMCCPPWSYQCCFFSWRWHLLKLHRKAHHRKKWCVQRKIKLVAIQQIVFYLKFYFTCISVYLNTLHKITIDMTLLAILKVLNICLSICLLEWHIYIYISI